MSGLARPLLEGNFSRMIFSMSFEALQQSFWRVLSCDFKKRRVILERLSNHQSELGF